MRVLQQSALRPIDEKNIDAADRLMVQGAAIEALGVLGCLCTVDPAVVPRVLPAVKRLDRRSSAPADALLNLTVMRFFIDHQDHVVYDLPVLFTL